MLNILGGRVSPRGDLKIAVFREHAAAPLSWKMRNTLRWSFLIGWLQAMLALLFSKITGMVVFIPTLSIDVIKKSGQVVHYGVVSYRKVTTAGVAWLVDAWQGTYEPETMKYHGCGTGTNAEANSDTQLQTESTTALNPDSTRATGSLTEGASANIFKTVGTLTFDSAAAITEHGILNQAATGGGTLWDRSVFSAVNVASGDSIQFTYELTCSAEA